MVAVGAAPQTIVPVTSAVAPPTSGKRTVTVPPQMMKCGLLPLQVVVSVIPTAPQANPSVSGVPPASAVAAGMKMAGVPPTNVPAGPVAVAVNV